MLEKRKSEGARPPVWPYLANKVVPVLAPHVGTACDVNAQLLVSPQHTLGKVGEECSSFPMR